MAPFQPGVKSLVVHDSSGDFAVLGPKGWRRGSVVGAVVMQAARFVQFGCTQRVNHALARNLPKTHTKTGMRRVQALRRYGYTHGDTQAARGGRPALASYRCRHSWGGDLKMVHRLREASLRCVKEPP